MNDLAPATSRTDPVPRSERFDSLTIAMHWATLGLLVVAFAAAWRLHAATSEASADAWLLLHRSTGALIWTLTLFRLGWKHSLGRAAALPPTLSPLQRAAARITQVGLYALLVVQPITGFLQSALRGKPFPLLGFTVPEVLARNKPLTKLFHNIHEVSAWALLALIAVHACAALLHHFVLRDGVLRAMLPGRRGGVG